MTLFSGTFVETAIVVLLVAGCVFCVARAAWNGVRAASAEKAAGCGSCNGCGGCPTTRV